MFAFDIFWVVWVLVFSGTQVKQQIITDLDYFSDYISVSYDRNKKKGTVNISTIVDFSNNFTTEDT